MIRNSEPAPLDIDQCWQAVQQRDSAQDGDFVYAVSTTRIYCRPSCSSRRPRREHTRFFALPAAAEHAGYRPCRRCHPKRTAMRDLQAQRVEQVCQQIAHSLEQGELPDLNSLAEAVHTSPYHLQRSFKRLMGISPRQYTDALRLNRFKTELRAGSPVLDAVYEAGYGSTSRAYAHSENYLGMTPSDYRSGAETLDIHYSVVDSSLGRLLVAATERGICTVKMGENDAEVEAMLRAEFPAAAIQRDDDRLSMALQALLDYLGGWSPHLDLPLDIRVTAFQQRVLDELCRIPYGETRSYAEIAAAIGKPKAARAVGQACATNPVPLIIPCHRVVRSDGSIRGYAFGDARKRALLDLEQGEPDDDKV